AGRRAQASLPSAVAPSAVDCLEEGARVRSGSGDGERGGGATPASGRSWHRHVDPAPARSTPHRRMGFTTNAGDARARGAMLMSKLRVHAYGISIDGYGAGPDQDLANPMGVGGMALHEWVLGTKTFRRIAGDFAGELIGERPG